jgi:hypothetical protein
VRKDARRLSVSSSSPGFPPGELSQPGERQEENAAPTIESAIASTSLHTTTDTLNFLSQVANWPKQLSEEGSG